MNVPVTGSALFSTVTASSQQLGAMTDNRYLFASTVNCWILQGANPTATAADGSMFVPANTQIVIWGGMGAKLAVLRDGGSDGKCSLTRTSNL